MPEDEPTLYIFSWNGQTMCVESDRDVADFFWMERQWWWITQGGKPDGG